MSEQNGKALALSPSQAPLAQRLELDRERLALLSRTLGTNLKPDELHLFLAVSARLGLDPFTKQIHAIKDGQGRFFLHVGIDGRRAIAQRTGMVDGMLGPFWYGEDGTPVDVWLSDEAPKAARVGILKKGCREPFWGTAHLKSFRTRNPNWQDRPEHMLAKVAEDHALRKAFPYEMGGIPTAYSPEHDAGTDDQDEAGGALAAGQEQEEPAAHEGEYREVHETSVSPAGSDRSEPSPRGEDARQPAADNTVDASMQAAIERAKNVQVPANRSHAEGYAGQTFAERTGADPAMEGPPPSQPQPEPPKASPPDLDAQFEELPSAAAEKPASRKFGQAHSLWKACLNKNLCNPSDEPQPDWDDERVDVFLTTWQPQLKNSLARP